MRARVAALTLLGISAGLFSARPAGAALIGYYPLDGNFNDASGNGNNGTASVDPPTFVAGHTGLSGDQGALFSGTDASQFFTIPINLNNLDQVTFGAWIQVNNTNPIRGIISDDPGGFGRTIDIDDRAGTTGISAFDGNGVFGGITPSDTGFDFVAVAYNHTAGTETLYVNGTSVGATGTPPAGETVITVGRNPNFDNPFGGIIDDVFVYNTALSGSEIANIEANGVQASPVGPTVPLPSAAWSGLAMLAGLGVLKLARRRLAMQRA
jgi:hypothetical protein